MRSRGLLLRGGRLAGAECGGCEEVGVGGPVSDGVEDVSPEGWSLE